jgi:hypothetical protein
MLQIVFWPMQTPIVHGVPRKEVFEKKFLGAIFWGAFGDALTKKHMHQVFCSPEKHIFS